MARLLALEDISSGLRTALASVLRVCDEAVVLPNAGRSQETGAFKNVVCKLAGDEPGVHAELFSPNWFAGVTAVAVPGDMAEPLLRDPAKRAAALKRLVAAIPSEMADVELEVGPSLDGDTTDRDVAGWSAGFDGTSCTIGLFSARQQRAPEVGAAGMNRAHAAYFLVCKAGGGTAAATFHARLTAALRKGRTLNDAFDAQGDVGPQALRRVAMAAQRNRARLLVLAAEAIGFHAIDTLADNASAPSAPQRAAIPTLDASYNVLRKLNDARGTWQYSAGCVDAVVSQGLITASNVAEGFVAFTGANDQFKIALRNDAASCLPFSTLRLKSSRELVQLAADACKTGRGHPDHEFVRERFGWKSKPLGQPRELEPPALYGSHAPETFLASWSRELGVAALKTVRMAPEIVCISAIEPAKLRAAVRSLR